MHRRGTPDGFDSKRNSLVPCELAKHRLQGAREPETAEEAHRPTSRLGHARSGSAVQDRIHGICTQHATQQRPQTTDGSEGRHAHLLEPPPWSQIGLAPRRARPFAPLQPQFHLVPGSNSSGMLPTPRSDRRKTGTYLHHPNLFAAGEHYILTVVVTNKGAHERPPVQRPTSTATSECGIVHNGLTPVLNSQARYPILIF